MVSERPGAASPGPGSAAVAAWPRRVVVAGALIGMLTCAGWALDRTYTGDLLVRLCAGAAAGAVLVSLVARRLPAWAVAPLSVLGLGGYVVLSTRVSAAAGGVPGAPVDLAADALRDGVPRLLSALVPVEPQPDTVLVPVLATWLAGLAAAELALRADRGLGACAPPVGLYAAALVLTGPHVPTAVAPTLAFAGCVTVVLAASMHHRAPDDAAGAADRLALRARVVAGALVALSAVLALGAAAGPLVAVRVDRTPVDLRREVVPPRLDTLDENPLVRLSGWALTPDRRLLDVDVGSAGGPVRIRLAVMGDYDGVTWRVGASYREAGRVLPALPPPGEGVRRRAVRQRITIGELDGRLLPAAATPRRIDGVRVAYDPGSGTVALPGGLRPGMAYTVDSDLSTVDVNILPGVDAPAGPAVARFLALGSAVPPELARLAAQLGEGSAAPYQRALAVEQFLAEHYQLVGDAPSGHAYPNLSFFLFGPRLGGGQRGTTEQFAAAFAVLGRILGLPTRVVLGFTARPGRPAVRAADAFAWPEVLFEGVGWVPFDPLPQNDAAPRPVEDDFKPSPPPSAPPPSSVPPPSASATPSTSPSSVDARPAAPPPADRTPLLLLSGAMAGALGMGYLIAIPLLRRRLRRVRLAQEAAPAHRIAGAWREVLDGLRLAGRPAPAHLVVTEIAAYAAGVGGEGRGPRPVAAGGRAGGGGGELRSAAPGGLWPPPAGVAPGDVPAGPDGAAGVARAAAPDGVGVPAGLDGAADVARAAEPGGIGVPAAPGGVGVPAAPGGAAGPAGLDDLARLANAAAFGSGTLGTAQAELAVQLAQSYVDKLRGRQRWWRRLRWTLDPRPLWWR